MRFYFLKPLNPYKISQNLKKHIRGLSYNLFITPFIVKEVPNNILWIFVKSDHT